jgi:hypothetical protein
VNWYKGPDGRDRIWFDHAEIESMAEGELRKAGLLSSVDAPAVDIERFVEVHLRVALDQHADLDPDILGQTQFRPGLPPGISINRDLTNAALDAEAGAPGLLGRWRATLAHEAAHVLLHQVLFDIDPNQESLFDSADGLEGSRLMRCLKREVTFVKAVSDWREVQANRAMAALLMPKSIFQEVARLEFDRLRQLVGTALTSDSSDRVAGTLSGRFDVSRQAASIRLETLGLVKPISQPALEVS